MKRIIAHLMTAFAVLTFSLFAAETTFAADFGRDAPVGGSLKDGPIVLPPSWQGFYLGGNIGGAWGEADSDLTERDTDVHGFAGGFHGGYNWQRGNTVFGIEGDYTFTDLDGDRNVSDVAGFDNARVSANIDYLASIRGRLGYATSVSHIYFTGGFAWSDLEITARDLDTGNSISRDDDNLTGYVIGGGGEYKVAPNTSLRGEVLYYDVDAFDSVLVRAGLSVHFN